MHLTGPFTDPERAFTVARGLLDALADEHGALEVIGDFVIPPAGDPPSRDFQMLHLDFGLPLDPRGQGDVARYTALRLADTSPAALEAVTRLVPLAGLLGQRPWPRHDELLRRFEAYGHSHGAWEDADGYVEASLARMVEAALGDVPVLPSVKADPAFLCGEEFDSVAAETAFFADRGLRLSAVQVEVRLQPGELLLFDNLVLAHGRRGARAPGELQQRVFGHRGLGPEGQRALRDRVLAAFAGDAGHSSR